MRWIEALGAACRPLSERGFVIAGITAIVLIRLLVILATPRTADFADPRIYQAAGQLVLAGVNPYDYSDHATVRAAMRARMAGASAVQDEFTATQESWDYYVSGNPPASTALYALFEKIAHGSRFAWRLLLILGDISLFLGLLALLKRVHGRIGGTQQLAIACLAIINPVLIVSGCAIPEDKQFETALLLWTAALLLSPPGVSRGRDLWTGILLSLSILFKLLGALLLPLWLWRARRDGPRFVTWTLAGGVIPLAASFAWFGLHFVQEMLARGARNSFATPEHASPWTLFEALAASRYYLPAKGLVTTLFCALLAGLLVKRRIDTLNFCAGLLLALLCVWLDQGAMNRINIGILFAVAALTSLSDGLFLRFSAGIVLVAGLGYALGVGLLRMPLASVDAVLVLLFLVAYVVALLAVPRSPIPAAGAGGPEPERMARRS